jgi:hypothetical protein
MHAVHTVSPAEIKEKYSSEKLAFCFGTAGNLQAVNV